MLVILFTGISEYLRFAPCGWGVRDAVQAAVISTVVENCDDVYHGVREGYSGGYQPMAENFEGKGSTMVTFTAGLMASWA